MPSSTSLIQEEHKLQNALAPVQTQAQAQAAFVNATYSFRPRINAALKYFDTDEKQHNVIEAMKIQRAYRCYRKRKQMAAAALIQLDSFQPILSFDCCHNM
ncbi:hypothetical protein E3N88_14366 [Mikania micrantha]|uniref:Uncharacterized protein n=1 Tax=Mikania micrantha TaxID=192012 RepID=A0A5N6P3U6_9ASTR|nr:hypothetical protein E3N88_14366 [Mikania micrantha]